MGALTSLDFNEDSITEYIKRRFGAPKFKLELQPENFEIAINDALLAYNRLNPRIVRIVIPVIDGQTKYTIPEAGRGILEVQPARSTNFLPPGSAFSINLGDGIIFRHIPGFRDTFGIDQINELLIYNEMTLRLLSADPQWEEYEGDLYVSNLPPGTTHMAVLCSTDYDLATLPPSDRDWVRRYALAIAKQILGEIRGKFPVPGPAGQQFLLRAGELIREGQEEELRLLDRLDRRSYQLPPSWG